MLLLRRRSADSSWRAWHGRIGQQRPASARGGLSSEPWECELWECPGGAGLGIKRVRGEESGKREGRWRGLGFASPYVRCLCVLRTVREAFPILWLSPPQWAPPRRALAPARAETNIFFRSHFAKRCRLSNYFFRCNHASSHAWESAHST